MAWFRRSALATSLLAGVALVAAVVFTAQAPTPTALTNLALGLAIAPAAAVLGALIAVRRPCNPVGFLLAFVGFTVAFTVAKETGWQALAQFPQHLGSFAGLAAALDQSVDWVLVAVALLLLYFPDGHLPGRRWRAVPATLVVGALLDEATTAFDQTPFRAPLQDLPRPFGPLPLWLQVPGFVGFVLLLALSLAAAVSLIGRFRRADRVSRARIKWIALAGIGVPLFPLLCLAEILLTGQARWFSVAVGVLGLAGIPVATGISMLRHDLYDVDRALAATVTYGFLTAVVVGLYGISTLLVGVLLGRSSAVAAAAATAVCAMALSPLRARLQRAVDRRLYPMRRTALAALEALTRDCRVGLAHPEQLEQVLRDALRDPTLRIGYEIPGRPGYLDTAAAAVNPAGATAVVLGGRPIGVIRPDRDGLRPELLREIAGAAATLVEVVRLRLEVAQALREVETSRARLVSAGYQERRRLEHDLHDGAQQRLASLGMAFRLAQRHLDDGTVDVNGLLDQGVAELGTALAELRRIAHGLHPGRLDDGLDAAVAELIRSVPMPIEVEIRTDALPDVVATTAYYVVSEALTNAVKHAAADRIGLHIDQSDGHLLVRVSDDGCGGALLSARSSLSDRVVALGGTLRVDSPPGGGTTVEAVLPCAS